MEPKTLYFPKILYYIKLRCTIDFTSTFQTCIFVQPFTCQTIQSRTEKLAIACKHTYIVYIYIRNICVYILCTDIMLPYVWCSDTPTMDLRNLHNSLHWRHNDHDCVSNHQPHGCLLNRLLRRRSKKTSKLRVTGLFTGAGEFPAQRASYAKNVSVSCRHHVTRSMW